MTLTEAKKLMIGMMQEKESIHYVMGWLKQSYYGSYSDEIEAAVVTRQLKEYGVEVEIKG